MRNMASKGKRKRKKISSKSQKIKLWKCSACDKSFECRGQLQKHTKSHKKSEALRCNNCNKISKNRAQLIKHQCKDFICDFCDSPFKSKLRLEFHIQRHDKEDKPFKCNSCCMKFKSKIDCEKHQAIHKITKEYKCMVCPSTFTLKCQLNKHYANHSPRDYPANTHYDCNICGAAFEFKLDLTKHYSTHSEKDQRKDKSFVCNVCQGTFECETRLREHYDVHRKDISVIGCNICNLKFKRKSTLKEHYNKAHSKTVPNNCIICDLLFESRETYLQHFTEIHCGNIVFTCDICNSTFATKNSLKSHINYHKQASRHNIIKSKDITSHFDYNRRYQKDLKNILNKLTHFEHNEKTPDKLELDSESHGQHKDLSSRQERSCKSTSLSFDKSNNDVTSSVNCTEVEQNYESSKEKIIECTECGVSFRCKIEFWEHIMNHLENNESVLNKEKILSDIPLCQYLCSTVNTSQTESMPLQELDERDVLLLMNEIENRETQFETCRSPARSSVGPFEDTTQVKNSAAGLKSKSYSCSQSLLSGLSSEQDNRKEQKGSTEAIAILEKLFESDSLHSSKEVISSRACQVNTKTMQGSASFCPYCHTQFLEYNVLLDHLKTCLCKEDVQLTTL